MKVICLSLLLLTTVRFVLLAQSYAGQAWHDTLQSIPGRIQCEYYDQGGQGVAYSDSDPVNQGSGKLNPDDGTYFNTFRIKEGVDISYTKANDIDNNSFNVVDPLMDQLYVGWTQPGEWVNYSVHIDQAGKYRVWLMYTANADGRIALLLDGNALSSDILVRSTYNFKEPIAWRQWHHWNKATIVALVELPVGKHVLTLRTVATGNMNYDYLEFEVVK